METEPEEFLKSPNRSRPKKTWLRNIGWQEYSCKFSTLQVLYCQCEIFYLFINVRTIFARTIADFFYTAGRPASACWRTRWGWSSRPRCSTYSWVPSSPRWEAGLIVPYFTISLHGSSCFVQPHSDSFAFSFYFFASLMQDWRIRPKKGELRELPYTEIVKSRTIRLISDDPAQRNKLFIFVFFLDCVIIKAIYIAINHLY